MERVIQSIDFIESDVIHTVSVGKEFGEEMVLDIIEHNGRFTLYNSSDELIAQIKLPVFDVKYIYPIEEVIGL